MPTILRRALFGLLICSAVAAIVWRMTWGTDDAIWARAQSRAGTEGKELSMQVERQEAEGTGPGSYDMITNLVATCRKQVRDEVGKFPFIEVDRDVPIAEAFIYTHLYQGNRYVGVKVRDAVGENAAASGEPLRPPIAGSYIVTGDVAYSTAPIQNSSYEHRTYYCVANVGAANVQVKSVSLELVQ